MNRWLTLRCCSRMQRFISLEGIWNVVLFSYCWKCSFKTNILRNGKAWHKDIFNLMQFKIIYLNLWFVKVLFTRFVKATESAKHLSKGFTINFWKPQSSIKHMLSCQKWKEKSNTLNNLSGDTMGIDKAKQAVF